MDALGFRHQTMAELEEQRRAGTGRKEATETGQKDEANAMKTSGQAISMCETEFL